MEFANHLPTRVRFEILQNHMINYKSWMPLLDDVQTDSLLRDRRRLPDLFLHRFGGFGCEFVEKVSGLVRRVIGLFAMHLYEL